MDEKSTGNAELRYRIECLLDESLDSVQGCRFIIDAMRRSGEELDEARPALNTVLDSLNCAYRKLNGIRDILDFGETAEAFKDMA